MPDDLTHLFDESANEVSRALRLPPASKVRHRAHRAKVRYMAAMAVTATVVAATVGVTYAQSTGEQMGQGEPQSSFKMPHEGEPGWSRDNDPRAKSAFAGCYPNDPTMTGRVWAITMRGPGRPVEESHSPTRQTQQLFMFESEQAAQTAIAKLRDGVGNCGWIDPRMGQQLSGTRIGERDVERVSGIQIQTAVFLVHTVTGGAMMSSAGGNELQDVRSALCKQLLLCGGGPTPTLVPTAQPTLQPTNRPTVLPSTAPTSTPIPTPTPTLWPSGTPTPTSTR